MNRNYHPGRFVKCFSTVFLCLTYLMYMTGICIKGFFGAITVLSSVSFAAFIWLFVKSRKDARYDNMCLVGVFSFLIWVIADFFYALELNGHFGALISQIMMIVTVTVITLLSYFPARAIYKKTAEKRTENRTVAASVSSLAGILLGWGIGKAVVRHGSGVFFGKTDVLFLLFSAFVLLFQTVSIILIMQFPKSGEKRTKKEGKDSM